MIDLRFLVASLLTVSVHGAGPQTKPAQPPAVVKPAEAPPSARRTRVVTKLAGFELVDTARMERQTTVAGASRGAATVLPLAPRLAKIYSATPALTWFHDAPTDTAFTVRVYNEDEELVHEAAAKQRRYQYGQRGPALRAGKTYYWTVEVAALPASRSAMAGVKLVESAERDEIAGKLAAIAGDDEAAHLARARVFVQHRVWYDALAEYDAAVAAAPASAAAHEQRGELLAQLPQLQALAEAEFATADALSRVGQ